jgi:signal transduction histidine kinase
MVVERQVIDLSKLGSEALDAFGPAAKAKGLAVSLDSGEETRFRSDPRLLKLLLRHLLDNAIKFTDRGSVRLAVSREADELRVEVADTGRGIAPEQRTRIFEPFRDGGDVSHKHVGGIGLGLSIVRQVVEMLGGRIDLVSELGRGTTVTVWLRDVPQREPA